MHWNADEAAERAARLRTAGYRVSCELPDPKVFTKLRRDPPDAMVIDGYDFEHATLPQVQDLRDLAEAMSLQAWYSAVRHRDDPRASGLGVPAPCDRFEHLFETILLLDPGERGVRLRTLKGDASAEEEGVELLLDPSTFLVSEG